MTKPRPWPNRAEWARQDAIALARRIVEEAQRGQDILERERNPLQVAIILGRVIAAAGEIQRIMLEVRREGGE